MNPQNPGGLSPDVAIVIDRTGSGFQLRSTARATIEGGT